jgi:hypothetical protein
VPRLVVRRPATYARRRTRSYGTPGRARPAREHVRETSATERQERAAMSIVTILIIVVIVLLVLGFFGRGRF